MIKIVLDVSNWNQKVSSPPKFQQSFILFIYFSHFKIWKILGCDMASGFGLLFFLPSGDGLREQHGPTPPWWLLGGDGGGGGGGLAFLRLPSCDASRLTRLLVGRGGSAAA